jgi:large subunit ribosomal protein L9
MQVILLERVGRLGAMGETVKVKDGYARNFLLPNQKALRATAANKAKFETQRAVLEAKNAATKELAVNEAKQLEGKVFIVIRQAGESGQLYGSVTARDIGDAAAAQGSTVDKNHIHIQKPIKVVGMHEVQVTLHPEVVVAVTVNVARTADEAAAQARGDDLTAVGATEKAEARAAAEAMFEQAQADALAEEEGGK